MTARTFVVKVADLEGGPQRLSCPLPSAWLAHVLADTDAKPREDDEQGGGQLDLELSLNGREVVVRGSVEATLEMPCSITLDPVPVDVKSDVFLLLAPRATAPRAGTRRLAVVPPPERGRGGDRANARAGRPEPGPGVGPRRDRQRKGEGESNWSEDALLSDDDAARDTYEGDEVVLDGFLREFIVLELPMNPRRSDLRSDEDVAIALRSAGLTKADEPSVDPRLAPLAAIASRLRQKKE